MSRPRGAGGDDGFLRRIAERCRRIRKGVAGLRQPAASPFRLETVPALYTPQHVANFFLARAEDEGRPMCEAKLNRLACLAYGWVLAMTDRHLFAERIQAWKVGPVVPTLHHEFKSFGRSPITGRSWQADFDSWDIFTPEIPEDDRRTRAILDRVWTAHRGLSATELGHLTREPGSPWARAFRDGFPDACLADDHVRAFYRAALADRFPAAAE